MTREQYLAAATSWTHHRPYIEQPRPSGIPSPRDGYEVFPGWQILIMITSECNTQCRHCYLPFSGKFEPKVLLELIKQFQLQGYNVYLNGAEPLLDRGYLPAFKLADQKIIMTNGRIIAGEPSYIYDIKEAGIETIGISYHFDIQKTFSKVLLGEAKTALDITKSAGLHARVMTTVTKPYLEKLPEYCAWCVEKGYPEIRFTNYMQQGKARNLDSELVLTADDRKRYYEIISNLREKYPIDVLRISSCGSFGACGTPNMSCMAMRDFVVLTPDMKVYPCFFMSQQGMECGFYENGYIFTRTNHTLPEHDCSALHLFNDQ